jgi:Xaa-Pro aminopeptidase
MTTLATRKEAVLKRMKADGLQTLVLACSGRHMIDESDPITHMTAFIAIGPALMVLTEDGQATLINAPASDFERLLARVTTAECLATDDLARTFGKFWRKRQWGKVGSVGLEMLPYEVYGQIAPMLPSEPVPFDGPFYAATGAKTEDELRHARHATAIAEQAMERVLSIARPGMRECDLGVDLNLYMKELGANDSFLMLNAGKQSSGVMTSSHRMMEKGDLLLLELSPSVEGQFVQICRIVSIGPPSTDLVEKYQLLCDALQQGIAAVRPGVKMLDVCNVIDRRMEAAGYAKYSRPPYLRRRGHGLSCGTTYPGDVAFDNPNVLEPDMLFMVHPNQFLPGPGYMMCGEPVRVTTDGAEVLSKTIAFLGVVQA